MTSSRGQLSAIPVKSRKSQIMMAARTVVPLPRLGARARMDLIGGTVDVFGSDPDIVVDPFYHSLTHPIRPHHSGTKPLRMVDHDMKRRPLDGNARSLEPDTQLAENIVDEALIARVVCEPAHNVGMCGDRVDVWRSIIIFPLSTDLDRR